MLSTLYVATIEIVHLVIALNAHDFTLWMLLIIILLFDCFMCSSSSMNWISNFEMNIEINHNSSESAVMPSSLYHFALIRSAAEDRCCVMLGRRSKWADWCSDGGVEYNNWHIASLCLLIIVIWVPLLTVMEWRGRRRDNFLVEYVAEELVSASSSRIVFSLLIVCPITTTKGMHVTAN